MMNEAYLLYQGGSWLRLLVSAGTTVLLVFILHRFEGPLACITVDATYRCPNQTRSTSSVVPNCEHQTMYHIAAVSAERVVYTNQTRFDRTVSCTSSIQILFG